jgi:hypothetical protein
MPFKKPNNNNKNKTKKQQKKKAAAKGKPADDASSVEEIVVTESNSETTLSDAQPLEEVHTEKILTEEELAEIAAHEQYMWENYYRPQQEETIKRWRDAQIAMLDDPEYWESRIDNLLRARERYQKKAAWSPEVFHEVDSIDKEIRYCEEKIDSLDGIEQNALQGNPLLGGMDWWKDSLTDTDDGWVSSK